MRSAVHVTMDRDERLAATSMVLPFDFCLRAAVLALIVWAIAVTPQSKPVANPDLTKPD